MRGSMNQARTSKTHTMLLEGTPESVFPLLCPIREYEWIEAWRCTLIYSESGHAEQDCVFQTDFPQDGPTDTWVVSRYEDPRLIEFVRSNGIRTIRYTITLCPTESGKTEAEWRKVVTGLAAEGNRVVAGLSDDEYVRQMQTLQRLLNHYLTTGQMLKHAEG
jgi:hypothetical protein